VYYAFSPTVSGGASPYVWTSTTLPAGLALDSRTGFITGTPTAAGTFPVVLTVTDANGVQVNRNLSMVIDGAAGGGAGVDTTPPQLLFSIPASGSTDVDRCSDVVVRFNEAIDPVTVTNVSMFVRRAGGATFSMAGTAPVDERTFILNQGFANCYAPGTNYELVLTDSIRDISDNPLAQVVVPFSTGGDIDDVPPQVAFTIPADGAVDVSPTADVTVVFNEAMDTNSIVPQSFAVYRITGFGGTPTQVTVGSGSDTSPSTLPTATDLIAETDRRFTFGPVEYSDALPRLGLNLVPARDDRDRRPRAARRRAGAAVREAGDQGRAAGHARCSPTCSARRSGWRWAWGRRSPTATGARRCARSASCSPISRNRSRPRAEGRLGQAAGAQAGAQHGAQGGVAPRPARRWCGRATRSTWRSCRSSTAGRATPRR
jgi:hypothetical protein